MDEATDFNDFGRINQRLSSESKQPFLESIEQRVSKLFADSPAFNGNVAIGSVQENKEMRVPVSSQIYPPPVSIDAKLLPPVTDGQALCSRPQIRNGLET